MAGKKLSDYSVDELKNLVVFTRGSEEIAVFDKASETGEQLDYNSDWLFLSDLLAVLGIEEKAGEWNYPAKPTLEEFEKDFTAEG